MFQNFKYIFPFGIAFFLLFAPLQMNAQSALDTSLQYLRLLSHWDNDQLDKLGGEQKFNDIWGWTSDEGKEYAIFGSTDSIYFMDISNPYRPKLCNVQAGKAPKCTHRDFKTYKHYAYAVADENYSSLQIFDLQYLPDSVHKVYDSDSLVVRSHNIFIDNGRLYVAAHKMWNDSFTNIEMYPMSVYSLQNPERPTLLAHLRPFVIGSNTVFDYVHDVFVRNDTTYLSCGNPGLFIYNMKDPANPKLLQSIQPPYPGNGYNHSSWLSADGNKLVFADETWGSPLKLYDVSKIKNPNNTYEPEYISIFGSRFKEGSIPHNPFIKDNFVYISYYHEGIVVFDITDANNPKKIAQYDTYPENDSWPKDKPPFKGYAGAWGVYPFFPSGVIAGIDMKNGLFLLKLDTFPKYEQAQNIFIKENPFREEIQFKIGLNEAAQVDLWLYDITGRLLLSKNLEVARGDTYYSIPVSSSLRNGMYILVMKAKDASRTFKVFKF